MFGSLVVSLVLLGTINCLIPPPPISPPPGILPPEILPPLIPSLPSIFPSLPSSLVREKYIRKALGCQNDTLTLLCPPGNQIYIFNADYGRYTAGVCPLMDSSMDLNACMSKAGTTETITELCGEKDTCTIPVTDEVFGENCPTTHKYAVVTYKCESYARACEGDNLIITCPLGTTISIYDANFGRTLPGTDACPGTNTDNTKCYSGSAVSISQSICEGQPACIVPASSTMFGDPCEGQHKYLEINYLCE